MIWCEQDKPELAMWLSNSPPATVSLDEVENILRTDRARGLTQGQAEERHNTFGYNELVGKEEDPVWKKYLEQFKNPLILLLLGSTIVSVVMGQLDDAASNTLAIVIVVTVGYIQQYRLERLVTCSDFAVDESSLTGEPVVAPPGSSPPPRTRRSSGKCSR